MSRGRDGPCGLAPPRFAILDHLAGALCRPGRTSIALRWQRFLDVRQILSELVLPRLYGLRADPLPVGAGADLGVALDARFQMSALLTSRKGFVGSNLFKQRRQVGFPGLLSRHVHPPVVVKACAVIHYQVGVLDLEPVLIIFGPSGSSCYRFY